MSQLRQEIGLLQGIGLLATSLLGTGIFVVPAIAATIAGKTALWAWPILIMLTIPIAMTFARLGRHYPHAGGASFFVGKAFGPAWEQLTALLFLTVIPVGTTAGLHIAAGFVHALLPLSPVGELMTQLLTLGMILTLSLLGARLSGNVQIAIAALILLLIVAIAWQSEITLADSLPDTLELPALGQALAVIFWCFIGIEAFAHMSEEFKHPQRDFPRAVLLGCIIAGGVYWACSVIVLKFGAFGSEQQALTAIPSVLSQLFGPTAQYIAGGIGYLACFASANIYFQGFSRLVWSQARVGRLPALLAHTTDRGVPAYALMAVVIAGLLSVLLIHMTNLPLDALIRYANGNFIMIYLLAMAAGWKLFRCSARWLAMLAFGLTGFLFSLLGQDSYYTLAVCGAFGLWMWIRGTGRPTLRTGSEV